MPNNSRTFKLGGGGVPVNGLGVQGDYLAIFKETHTSPPINNTLIEEHTTSGRIFVIRREGYDTPGLRTINVISYLNEEGSFALENTESITYNTAAVDTLSFFSVSSDDNYLYLMAEYTTASAREITVTRIDVTDLTSTTTTVINSDATLLFDDADHMYLTNGTANGGGIVVVADKLFTTYSNNTSTGNWDLEFREYEIVGTTYTLLNTYTSTMTAPNANRADTLSYNPIDDNFILSGNRTTYRVGEISGTDFVSVSVSNTDYFQTFNRHQIGESSSTQNTSTLNLLGVSNFNATGADYLGVVIHLIPTSTGTTRTGYLYKKRFPKL
jgi:hypothetical protein